jgi:hypothetical protein
MKPTTVFLAAMLAATSPLLHAATTSTKAPDPNQRTQVVFVDPDKFTDARDSYNGTDSGRDAILDQLREYMQTEAKRYLPDGDKLSVSVTDVDLAGDFEPWRGPQWDDVRVVKDIYPPRIKLSFQLTDSTGKVLKEGTRDLRDLAFMMKITMSFHDDPLRHEKQLLDDWFAEEFRGLKAK